MDIQSVLQGLDQLFANHRIGDVESYLTTNMDAAKEEQDMYSYITLLNEMIGFCRDTSQYEKAVSYCKLVEQEIKNQNLEGSVAHATTLLNIANAYRASSLLQESMENYQKVFPIYDAVLDKTDFRYASLYNNLSLLYQEMEDYEKACECLANALEIVALYPEARIELAVTHTNLAMSLLKLEKEQEAENHLNKAFSLFEQDEDKDYHYSAALSAMSELQYKKGDLDNAILSGMQALFEIERNVGRTKAYEVVEQNVLKMKEEQRAQALRKRMSQCFNISVEAEEEKQFKEKQFLEKQIHQNAEELKNEESQNIKSKNVEQKNEEIKNQQSNSKCVFEKNNSKDKLKNNSQISQIKKETENSPLDITTDTVTGAKSLKGMDLCRAYYETYKEQFLKGFEQYKPYMAFGLVGDGSECLGLDDEFSKDHDFGPGFCVFIPEKEYDIIGEALAKAYEKLPKEFMGYSRNVTKQGKTRVGVKTIEGFYKEYIGVEGIPQSDAQWFIAPPERFLAATSGEIFEDNCGKFTRIREGLKNYYPEHLRRAMLAEELSMMAQTGQYNYERVLKRGEKVTAQLILSKYMEHTMNTVYLLNKEYAPFYKWKHTAMTNLPILPEIMDILNAIADMEYGDERIVLVIEMIAKLIVNELLNQGLSDIEELYLDVQAHRILERANAGVVGMPV